MITCIEKINFANKVELLGWQSGPLQPDYSWGSSLRWQSDPHTKHFLTIEEYHHLEVKPNDPFRCVSQSCCNSESRPQ
jgi:hypothetical protein